MIPVLVASFACSDGDSKTAETSLATEVGAPSESGDDDGPQEGSGPASSEIAEVERTVDDVVGTARQSDPDSAGLPPVDTLTSQVTDLQGEVDSHVSHLESVDEPSRADADALEGLANELDVTVSEFESKLGTVGDDAELADVDLQNMLEKQRQVVELLSSISRTLHETSLAIIRKIGD